MEKCVEELIKPIDTLNEVAHIQHALETLARYGMWDQTNPELQAYAILVDALAQRLQVVLDVHAI